MFKSWYSFVLSCQIFFSQSFWLMQQSLSKSINLTWHKTCIYFAFFVFFNFLIFYNLSIWNILKTNIIITYYKLCSYFLNAILLLYKKTLVVNQNNYLFLLNETLLSLYYCNNILYNPAYSHRGTLCCKIYTPTDEKLMIVSRI